MSAIFTPCWPHEPCYQRTFWFMSYFFQLVQRDSTNRSPGTSLVSLVVLGPWLSMKDSLGVCVVRASPNLATEHVNVCDLFWLVFTLQWRHNERDDVPDHQPHDYLLNRLFRRRSKKISTLRVTGICAENSPVTGKFPAQRASNEENVSILWRHYVCDHLVEMGHPYNKRTQKF